MRPGLAHDIGQGLPDFVSGGIADQYPVLDEPGFLAAPEGPDRDFDAILLHVSTSR